MSPTRGLILRAWREHAGLSLSTLAARTYMGISTLSMWEHGSRGRRMTASLETAQRIASALELPQAETMALLGLWQSGESAHALPPRRYWAHNFDEPNGPAWVWLRPAIGKESTVANLALGVSMRKQVELGGSPAGTLIQFPLTAPNPALEIHFNRPAWADFGEGELPADVAEKLGLKLIEIGDLIHGPLTPDALIMEQPRHSYFWLLMIRETAEQVRFRWPLFIALVNFLLPQGAPRSLVGAAPWALPANVAVDSSGLIETQLLITPRQLQRLREARGMGRRAAAAAATAMLPTVPVTAKMIEVLETSGRLPRSSGVLSRLDMVYRYDGHISIECMFGRHFAPGGRASPIDILFPVFWRGPVWLQFSGPADSAVGVTELAWGLLGCRHLVRAGTVVTTRKASADSPPVRVTLPRGWSVAAGLGVPPGAFDIGHDWRALSLRGAHSIAREVFAACGVPVPAAMLDTAC